MIRIEFEKKDGELPTLMMKVKRENTIDCVFDILYGMTEALGKIPGIDLKRKEDREMLVEAFRMMLEPVEPGKVLSEKEQAFLRELLKENA